MLWGELETVEHRRWLRHGQATAYGAQLADRGTQPAVQRFTRQLHRRAFPTLYRRRRAAPED